MRREKPCPLPVHDTCNFARSGSRVLQRIPQRSPARGIIKELPARGPRPGVRNVELYIATEKALDIGRRNWLRDKTGRARWKKQLPQQHYLLCRYYKFKYKLDTNIRRILRSSYQRPFARGTQTFVRDYYFYLPQDL